jgi:predicted ferric reductase
MSILRVQPPTAAAVRLASHRWAVAAQMAKAGAWIAVYVVMVAFPLLILLRGALPKGGGFWWDFAMALGFGGLALLGLQSVLTARFRRATAPFGVDIIYYFHRWAAIAGVGIVAGHYMVLRIRYGEAIGPWNPLAAPWHMTAGRAALLLLALLVVTSLWRQRLGIEYDRWRMAHAVMAVLGILLAMAHIWGVGHYTAAVWKGLPWAVFSLLWILVVVYVRIGRPWTMLREPYRVVDVRKERGRSWTLALKPDGHVGMKFSPGQFAWLVLRASPFRAKEHPFSFSGSAAGSNTLQFTIKELGDFTRTIGSVKVGEIAYVDGPHGVFTTDRHATAPGFVFIAGGVGIAPIMSMLRTLADRGDRRPLRLIYGNRRWDDVVFREELDALILRLDLVVAHVLQEPPADWRGAQGVLTESVLQSLIPDEARASVFFLCGPKPMSDSVQRSLRRMAVPLHRVHCELFEMV